ncbi:ribosome-recycling factor [bacterium BMS3Abin02]|nr:ribosome-recycling factor [bacterium BMS3Abin02]GBE21558.1 ribosome-recycling factor [bacterium BMS3Bbin01]HDH27435.1 ribosome recycling factor [Actinomycetota bacterium]HDK45158.1 ribosome recycling factor [Actinomycetota bacterium]HDL49368.1 ribosome recycling factor [Actinomycetota bacterium]
MIRGVLAEAERKMSQAIEHVQAEFATVRTGRANAGILSRVMVDYYGTPTPLQQLASFSVPEPRLLIVQPYDKTSIGAIEKAIRTSSLGMNPASDGHVLRLVFPTLTEERRVELTRVVRHMAEDGRVAVRNIRRHSMNELNELHGEISDDDIRRAEKELQELTDMMVSRVDELLVNKEQELLEV